MKFVNKSSINKADKSLTVGQKRTIDKAVKKTLKEYKKTLDLLAKT